MQDKSSLIFIFFIFFHKNLLAITLLWSGGLGQATSKNEITVKEEPLFQSYRIEHQYSNLTTFGVEHSRSLSIDPFVSSISFTGIYSKFYLSPGIAPAYNEKFNGKNDKYFTRIYSIYMGAGIGIGQASFLPQEGLSANSAALYLSLKGGLDLQMTEMILLGASLETYQTFAGSGVINGAYACGIIGFNF